MEKTNKINTRTLVLVGVLTALVFALSTISIQLGEVSRIHFGNIMCLLAGMLFGPWVGGLSAGIGSMLYDFTNPLYTPEFWITFITKFAMGWAAGTISRRMENKVPSGVRYGVAAFSGASLYVVLYMVKSAIMQHFVYGNPWAAVWPVIGAKGLISGVNALIAIAASVMLAPVLRSALNAAGLFRAKPGHPAG